MDTAEAGPGEGGAADAIRVHGRVERARMDTAEAEPGEGGSAEAICVRGRVEWARMETAEAGAGGGRGVVCGAGDTITHGLGA